MSRPEAGGGAAAWQPVAYVDESVQVAAQVYVLSAAVLEPAAAEDARDRMRALAPRSTRLHWRDADARLRRAAVATVAELPARHVVVVGTRITPSNQEHPRALCLRRLLWELADGTVGQVWIESRAAVQNRRDIATVTHSQRERRRPVRVDHQVPSVEPLLWIADVVAGAASLAEMGEGEYLNTLEPVVARHEFDVLDGP